MNKRFFSASRLMGAMLCLMLALTAFTSCREDDDKDAARFTSGVINLTPAWNVTKTTAGITLNVASAEVLNTYGKYNIRVWHNIPDPNNAEETIEEDIYNETFYSKIGVDELLKLEKFLSIICSKVSRNLFSSQVCKKAKLTITKVLPL